MPRASRKTPAGFDQLNFLDQLDISCHGLSKGCPSNSCGAYGFSALPAGNRNNDGNSIRCIKNSEKANPAQESLLSCIGEPNQSARKCLSEKFNRLCAELFESYREARKHKRNTVNQLQFEADLESNLLRLAGDLQNGTYEISRSVCFINEKPVKREIIAADFRDRVVHHLLFNWINPVFERLFIYDSYSCRVGKGTDFGISRAKGFIVSESRNFTRECFSLRLDISGFFMNIDRDILYSLIVDGLERGCYGRVRGGVPLVIRLSFPRVYSEEKFESYFPA